MWGPPSAEPGPAEAGPTGHWINLQGIQLTVRIEPLVVNDQKSVPSDTLTMLDVRDRTQAALRAPAAPCDLAAEIPFPGPYLDA